MVVTPLSTSGGGDNEEVGAAPPPVQPSSASSGRDDVEMDASAAVGGGAVSDDAPDDASPDDDGLVVDDTAAPKKKARITDAAKAALHKYFSDSNWSRNEKMPKQNGDMGLDNIINEFGLERSQASRQLRNWKGIVYENTQTELIFNPESIEKSIYQCMSMDPPEYIAQLLDDLRSGREVAGSSDGAVWNQSFQNHSQGHHGYHQQHHSKYKTIDFLCNI